MSEVYDESSEHTLIEPTFVMDHPREISPLARAHRDDPTLTERFELVVAGARARQRLQRAQRPGRPGRALPGSEARAAGRRRRRGRAGRRGLRRGARVRAAADRRARDRDGPPGDADRRRRGDPRRDPVPDAAPGGTRGRRRVGARSSAEGAPTAADFGAAGARARRRRRRGDRTRSGLSPTRRPRSLRPLAWAERDRGDASRCCRPRPRLRFSLDSFSFVSAADPRRRRYRVGRDRARC